MKPHTAIVAFCFFLLGSMQMSSQTPLQRREDSRASYKLGPGDQISVQVTDLDDLPNKPIQVDPDGFIDLPLIGPVKAAGLTLVDLKADLSTRLAKYITSPQITVNLTQNRSTPVSVVGAINSPGVQQLEGPRHLLEMISLSGGIRPDAGGDVIVTRQPGRSPLLSSESKVELQDGYSVARFSLDNLLAAKSPRDNILVEPGDVISIPKAELVYVMGDVRKAGGFTMSTHGSMPLTEALTLAEGTGPHASANHARILRQAPGGDGSRREILVDVDKILAGRAPDLPLYSNDVLFIPNSALKAGAERALEAALGVGTGVLIYRH